MDQVPMNEKNEDAWEAERRRTIENLERMSRLMDAEFRVPGTGTRFGLDGLLGLLPGVGDLLTTAPLAYYCWVAHRFGLGAGVWARLIANQAVDFVAGLVPLVGDLHDIGFKCNLRNAALLIQELERNEDKRPTDQP